MFSPSPTKQHDHWSISWILQCAFIKSPTRNAASKKVLRVGVKSSLVCTICTSPWHIAVLYFSVTLIWRYQYRNPDDNTKIISWAINSPLPGCCRQRLDPHPGQLLALHRWPNFSPAHFNWSPFSIFEVWTHFDFGWAPAVSWKKWHSADKGHPYPWSVSALLIVECNRSCFLLLFLFRNLSRERLMYSSNKAPPKTFLTALQWTAFHVSSPLTICCRCCSSSAVSSAADAKLVCWPNQWQRHISGRKTRRTTVVMLLSLSDQW